MPHPVESVRRFNRFYTRQIGLLDEGHLNSPYSLAEVRVLYEIAHRDAPTAAELADALALDRGYLSRILRRFANARLVHRQKSERDGRESHLSLTEKGRQLFATLNGRAGEEIQSLLAKLPIAAQQRLVDSMQTVQEILGSQPAGGRAVVLRPHEPGDIGWVIHRHGALYASEYGYDERFEGLVARIAADFLEGRSRERERCWIAELNGHVVGSVFVTTHSQTVAKLRLLYVEPHARGLGVGDRLIAECIRFARQARYRKMVLWTQSELAAARHLYEKHGFRLVKEEKHDSWSRKNLVAEVWERSLLAE